jgi:hypothetical protein
VEEELAVFEGQLEQLPQAFYIIAKKTGKSRRSCRAPTLRCRGRETLLLQKAPKPRRVSAKPMNCAHLILAIHWNLLPGSQCPDRCPELGLRLCLPRHGGRIRRLYGRTSRVEGPAIQLRCGWRNMQGDRIKEWLLGWGSLKKWLVRMVKEGGTWSPAELPPSPVPVLVPRVPSCFWATVGALRLSSHSLTARGLMRALVV